MVCNNLYKDLSIFGFYICRGFIVFFRIILDNNCNFNCILEYLLGKFRVVLWLYLNMLSNVIVKKSIIDIFISIIVIDNLVYI